MTSLRLPLSRSCSEQLNLIRSPCIIPFSTSELQKTASLLSVSRMSGLLSSTKGGFIFMKRLIAWRYQVVLDSLLSTIRTTYPSQFTKFLFLYLFKQYEGLFLPHSPAYCAHVVASVFSLCMKLARTVTKKAAKAMKTAVISIFFVKINPAEKKLKLITSSVKYSRNLPSLPNYLSHSGHRCFLEAVN